MMQGGRGANKLSSMERRTIVASVVAIAATTALAWWIKGDWEMAWLVWMMILPVAGAAVGLLAAVVLRGRIAFVTAAGSTASVVALWAAMATPHGWDDAAGRTRAEQLAAAMSDSTGLIEARVRELLRAEVDISGIQPAVVGGRIRKRPYRLLLDRDPATVQLTVAFALGPARPIRLRLEGDALTAPPEVVDSARVWPWVIREPALTRRFSVPALTVAGAGPWTPGDVVGVRLEHSESDWSLLLLRVGGPAGLEPVREVSREESRAGLARAAARAGRPVRDVRIFHATGTGVSFTPSNRLNFIGLADDPRANLRLVARVEGDEILYETADWFGPF